MTSTGVQGVLPEGPFEIASNGGVERPAGLQRPAAARTPVLVASKVVQGVRDPPRGTRTFLQSRARGEDPRATRTFLNSRARGEQGSSGGPGPPPAEREAVVPETIAVFGRFCFTFLG